MTEDRAQYADNRVPGQQLQCLTLCIGGTIPHNTTAREFGNRSRRFQIRSEFSGVRVSKTNVCVTASRIGDYTLLLGSQAQGSRRSVSRHRKRHHRIRTVYHQDGRLAAAGVEIAPGGGAEVGGAGQLAKMSSDALQLPQKTSCNCILAPQTGQVSTRIVHAGAPSGGRLVTVPSASN